MLAKAHPNNQDRLGALRSLGVLDSGAEQVYDDITQLTADLCDAPVCLISLVEEDRQWFKSTAGLNIGETQIEQSICAHAVAQDKYLEIPDTQEDERTIDNSLCRGGNPFRFYAGEILRTVEGWPIGTLCVLDYKPRRLTDIQKRILKVHAKSVTRQLELTRVIVQEAGAHWQDTAPRQSTEGPGAFIKVRENFDTLTPREKQIANLIAGRSGNLSSKEIGRELDISYRTVHHHRANIMAKMNVSSVAELISVGLKANLFS